MGGHRAACRDLDSPCVVERRSMATEMGGERREHETLIDRQSQSYKTIRHWAGNIVRCCHIMIALDYANDSSKLKSLHRA